MIIDGIGSDSDNIAHTSNGTGRQLGCTGSSANTLVGKTTVGSDVTLDLNKDFNTTAIIGEPQVDVGNTINIEATEQIENTQTVAVNGTLNVNNDATETIGDLQGTDRTAQIVLSNDTTGASLDIKAGKFTGMIFGGHAGNTSLTKSGTAGFVLAGNDTHSGETEITDGTLQISSMANDLVFSGSTLGVIQTMMFSTDRSIDVADTGGLSGFAIANEQTLTMHCNNLGCLWPSQRTYEIVKRITGRIST